MISLGNYQKFDVNTFIFAALTINLFLLGFVVVSDYSDLFFSPKHSLALAGLPVKEENIFVSKVSSAFIYLSVYPFVVSFPPSVYVYFYNHNLVDAFTFLLISFLFSYFVIGLVFIVNSSIIVISKSKSKILIFLMQILFVAFIFIVNNYSSNNSENLFNIIYIKYLPQYYLLLGFYNAYYLIAFVIITLVLFVFIYFYLKQNYLRISAFINTAGTSFGRKSFLQANLGLFDNFNLKNKTENASFALVKNHFKNTSVLKFRLIPLLFLPVVATIINVFSGMNEILLLSIMPDSSLLILNPAVSMTLIISSKILFTSLKTGFDEDENIVSLYSSLPIRSRFNFQIGVVKFINYYFTIPLVILCGTVILFKVQNIDVIYNLIFVLLFIMLVNIVTARLDSVLPFSASVSKFGSSSRYIQILVAMLIGIVFVVSQIIVFMNFIFFIIAIFVILLLIVLLNKTTE